MAEFKQTPYGFKWGAAEITRICSDDKKGWVVMELKTPKKTLQLYITKTGKVRIHGKDGEWLPKSKAIELWADGLL